MKGGSDVRNQRNGAPCLVPASPLRGAASQARNAVPQAAPGAAGWHSPRPFLCWRQCFRQLRGGTTCAAVVRCCSIRLSIRCGLVRLGGCCRGYCNRCCWRRRWQASRRRCRSRHCAAHIAKQCIIEGWQALHSTAPSKFCLSRHAGPPASMQGHGQDYRSVSVACLVRGRGRGLRSLLLLQAAAT